MNKERASQVEQNEAARKAAMDEAEENRRFVDDQTAFAVRAKQEEKIARIEAARRLQVIPEFEKNSILKLKNRFKIDFNFKNCDFFELWVILVLYSRC